MLMKRDCFYTPTKIQDKESISHLYAEEGKRRLSTMIYRHKPALMKLTPPAQGEKKAASPSKATSPTHVHTALVPSLSSKYDTLLSSVTWPAGGITFFKQKL